MKTVGGKTWAGTGGQDRYQALLMGAQQKVSSEARKSLNKHEISSWCELGVKGHQELGTGEKPVRSEREQSWGYQSQSGTSIFSPSGTV